MSESKYKVGDWVYHDFELKQVRRIEDGVTEVSDGHFSTSGFGMTDWMFPMAMDVKNVSATFKGISTAIHDKASTGLNYPDVKRWLVSHWVKTVNEGRVNKDTYQPNYDILYKFRDDMIAHATQDSGYGFPLFYQKLGRR